MNIQIKLLILSHAVEAGALKRQWPELHSNFEPLFIGSLVCENL